MARPVCVFCGCDSDWIDQRSLKCEHCVNLVGKEDPALVHRGTQAGVHLAVHARMRRDKQAIEEKAPH
jgi:hypothetical protein